MLCYIPPMVCVTSLLIIYSLLTPPKELLDTFNYLDHNIHSCPLDEYMMVHDQTMLSENFYEYTLLSQLTEAIPVYFDTIEPVINILVGTFIVSSFLTIVSIIRCII